MKFKGRTQTLAYSEGKGNSVNLSMMKTAGVSAWFNSGFRVEGPNSLKGGCMGDYEGTSVGARKGIPGV